MPLTLHSHEAARSAAVLLLDCFVKGTAAARYPEYRSRIQSRFALVITQGPRVGGSGLADAQANRNERFTTLGS